MGGLAPISAVKRATRSTCDACRLANEFIHERALERLAHYESMVAAGVKATVKLDVEVGRAGFWAIWDGWRECARVGWPAVPLVRLPSCPPSSLFVIRLPPPDDDGTSAVGPGDQGHISEACEGDLWKPIKPSLRAECRRQVPPNEAEWLKLWRGQEPVRNQVEWRYRAMCGYRLGACSKPPAPPPGDAPRSQCEMCEAVVDDLDFLLRVQKVDAEAEVPGEAKARVWAALEAVCPKVHWRHGPRWVCLLLLLLLLLLFLRSRPGRKSEGERGDGSCPRERACVLAGWGHGGAAAAAPVRADFRQLWAPDVRESLPRY